MSLKDEVADGRTWTNYTASIHALPGLEVLAERTLRREENRTDAPLWWRAKKAVPLWGPDGGTLSVLLPQTGEWVFLETASGQSRAVVPIRAGDQVPGLVEGPRASADGGRLLVWGIGKDANARRGGGAAIPGKGMIAGAAPIPPPPPPPAPPFWRSWLDSWLPPPSPDVLAAVVTDSATGQALTHIQTDAGREDTDCVLSPDGRLVVVARTVERGGVMTPQLQGWPVPSRRPWPWIAGPPLALGAALLALRWWWRRKVVVPR